MATERERSVFDPPRRKLTRANERGLPRLRAWMIALGASCLGIGGGCGPLAYVNGVSHASDRVEAARIAQAETYAPYYWTRATQYLHAAREKAARADFQGANRFGRLAAEAAEIATTEATIAAKGGRPGGLPAKDIDPIAPAKDEP